MSALPGSREPGVSSTNGTPAVAGCASSSRNASTPMCPSPMFWCRSLNAPRTSIESFACTSRSRPGPPISTIRSSVAAAPPGSSRGAPAANTWQVSRQMPALGWWSRASRYGARSSTPAQSERPWPAVGSSSSQGASSSATASSTGSRPSRTWRMAASYRSVEPPGSTNEPVCTTTPSAPISAARRRLWATEATDFSYVAGVGLPRFTRYGAWMNVRTPASAQASRKRASSRGSPADSAQPRGLPTNTWNVSHPSSRALVNAPATRPLPTVTCVPTGLRRAGSSWSGERVGMPRRLSAGAGQMTIRVTVLPLSARSP